MILCESTGPGFCSSISFQCPFLGCLIQSILIPSLKSLMSLAQTLPVASLDTIAVLITHKLPVLLTYFKWIRQEKIFAWRGTLCFKSCNSEVHIEQSLLMTTQAVGFHIIWDNTSVANWLFTCQQQLWCKLYTSYLWQHDRHLFKSHVI